MIRRGDVVSVKGNDYRSEVLKYLLGILEGKGVIEIGSLQSRSRLNGSVPDISQGTSLNKSIKRKIQAKQDLKQYYSRAKRGLNKIAIPLTIDDQSEKIVETLIKGNKKDLKNLKPVDGKVIKPLYLFLDKEVLLYAKLKKLKFKIKKEKNILDLLEKKHPEIKRAVVSSYLELYEK